MKKVLFTLAVSGLILLAIAGGCSWSGYQMVKKVLSNTFNLQSGNTKIFRWCFNGLPFVDQLGQLFDHKTYLIILQNNRELRPSGGFMGSYAKINLRPSGLASFVVQDIYVPDGQIAGHVDPPVPIQQAFGQGWWKLRDANLDPDFTVAGPQIAWFFDQGGEKADGLVAINLSLVNSLLQLLGEIKTTDYSEKISAQTFYDLAQKYAEVNFFPGSTQKRDFLGAVGNALMGRIISTTPVEKLKLAKLIWQQLKQGEILLWFKNTDLEETVKRRQWDGGLGNPTDDYLYIVETNLGANKANCCVTRQVTQEINGNLERVTIKYQNSNPFQNPKPLLSWGGDYIDYLRIIIPVGAEIKKVQVADQKLIEKQLDNQYGLQKDRFQIENRDNFKTIAFWAPVPANSSLIVEIEYSSNRRASLVVRKQPGMEPFRYQLVNQGKIVIDKTITNEETIKL